MSWKFPKHRPITTDSLDFRDINENFTTLVDEFSGEINEHNIKAGLLSLNGPYLRDGAGMTVEHYEHWVDPTEPTVPSSYALVPLEDSWVKLTNVSPATGDYAITFVSSGAPVWILASFQAHLRDTTSLKATHTVTPGFNFALMVDGAILYQSLVGGGDISNDHIQQLSVNMTQGPGVAGLYIPLVVEAIVDLPPGEHVINVCAKALNSYTPTSSAVGRTMGVLSRELIALELTR